MGEVDELAAADAGLGPGETPPPPPPDPAAVAVADDRQKWVEAVLMYGSMARAMLPDNVAPHWTDERLHNVGQALADVARHYGWTFADAISHPLWKLAGTAFPLAWPLLEPFAKPMLADLMGRKSIDVTPTTSTAEPPPPPAAAKPAKVDPVGWSGRGRVWLAGAGEVYPRASHDVEARAVAPRDLRSDG